jgi:hypothetical protein
MKKIAVRIPGFRRFLKRKDQGKKRHGRLHSFVDGSAKIVAAGAIVAAAIIANTYQSKMSTISLLSQRELAESQLRGAMFGNLISPIVGPKNANTECDPRREQLLVELLALNFHEHFESKPLMLHICKTIRKHHSIDEKEKKELTNSLESVARRVSARQIATLRMEGGVANAAQVNNLLFSKIEAKDTERNKKSEKDIFIKVKESLGENVGYPIRKLVEKMSPDKKWTLQITINEINPEESYVDALIDILPHSEIDNKGKDKSSTQNNTEENDKRIHLEFRLTYYDFPLTDNTMLADGNRFAFIVNDIQKQDLRLGSSRDASSNDQTDGSFQSEICSADLSLIWFPKDYFTPRERPINYSKFREKIGAKLN